MGDTSDFTKAELKLLESNNKDCWKLLQQMENRKN